jgi:hypothetical protein
MRLLLFLIMLVLTQPLYAQQKSWLTKHKYSGSMRNMSGKGGALCPGQEPNAYPLHGIGIKFGDPTALTYKFYATRNIAVAFDGGMAASTLYTRYYRSKFDEYTNLITIDPNAQEFNYLGQNISRDLFGEVKVLYSMDAGKIAKGLRIYTGLGWQWRSTDISYGYLIIDNVSGNEINSIEVKRATNGPSLTIGIEYAYFEMPISAFMEMQIFYDTVIDPGWIRPQGGIGIRYIF